MYTYIYVYIYIYIHKYIYIYISSLWVCAYIWVYRCVSHTHTPTHTHTHKHTYKCSRIYRHKKTHHTHTHQNVYIYIHTDRLTHTHHGPLQTRTHQCICNKYVTSTPIFCHFCIQIRGSVHCDDKLLCVLSFRGSGPFLARTGLRVRRTMCRRVSCFRDGSCSDCVLLLFLEFTWSIYCLISAYADVFVWFLVYVTYTVLHTQSEWTWRTLQCIFSDS